MLEPTLSIRFRNEIQGNRHRRNQEFRRAGADRTQKRLRLGDPFFHRRLIGTLRRHRLHRRADRLDRHACRHTLVRLQVVPDDHVTRLQGRQQYLFHIRLESLLSVAPQKANGATTPDSRKPTRNVRFCQLPGAQAVTRSPAGARPCMRVIDVVAPVSSTKTQWAGSTSAIFASKAARWAWTSGLSRWSAWLHFFLRVIPWRFRTR
jgi:hypothetical protein